MEEVASTTNEFSSTLDQVNSNAQTVGSAASAVADRGLLGRACADQHSQPDAACSRMPSSWQKMSRFGLAVRGNQQHSKPHWEHRGPD